MGFAEYEESKGAAVATAARNKKKCSENWHRMIITEAPQQTSPVRSPEDVEDSRMDVPAIEDSRTMEDAPVRSSIEDPRSVEDCGNSLGITFQPANDIPIIPGMEMLDLSQDDETTIDTSKSGPVVFQIGPSLVNNNIGEEAGDSTDKAPPPPPHPPDQQHQHNGGITNCNSTGSLQVIAPHSIVANGVSPARTQSIRKSALGDRSHSVRSKSNGREDGGEKASLVSFQTARRADLPSRAKDGAEKVEEEYDLVCPDGGWGWAVLVGATLVNVLIPGMIKSFGVLFVEFLEVFQASPAAASWIPALSYWLYSSCAPFASALSIRFSHRSVTIVGGFLATFGLVLSYFADSIPFLYVSYGLIGGLGAGLGFPPGVFLVGNYFDRLRGLANGLCTSGSAMGAVIMPPLLRYLISEYSYRGAILILGGLVLNTCVGAMLYQPVEKHMKRVPKKKLKKVSVELRDEEEEEEHDAFLPIKQPTDGVLTRNVSFAGSRRTSLSSYVSQSLPIAIPPGRDGNRPVAAGSSGGKKILPEYVGEPDGSLAITKSPSFVENVLDGENGYLPSSLEEEQAQALLLQKNLQAIPENIRMTALKGADWNYYESLPAAKQKLLRMSVGPPDDSLLRTISVASNVSTSSFHYISTIHHGSTLTVFQNMKNMPEFASTLTLRSVKNSFDCSPLDWIRRRFMKSDQRKLDLLDSKKKKAASRTDNNKKYFEFALLKDGVYLIILLSTCATAIGLTNFTILLPAYAANLGFSKSDGSLLLSIVAALDFVGRIGGAALSDVQCIPRKYYYDFGLLSSGIILSFLPLFTSYWAVATVCAAFGLASGTYVGVTAAILADQLGPEKLGSSFGLSLFISGLLQLVGPPVCGLLLEEFGSFSPLIVGLGVILTVGGISMFFVPLVEKRRKRKEEEKQAVVSNGVACDV